MHRFVTATFAAALSLGLLTSASAWAEDAAPPSGPFQIVKASENRVWRLNTETGEIAVCTLEDPNLVCTTSSEAVQPPGMTYEEWEAAKAADEAQAAEKRDSKQAEDRAMIIKFLDMIKEMIGGMS